MQMGLTKMRARAFALRCIYRKTQEVPARAPVASGALSSIADAATALKSNENAASR
jgi:hypothetical protein